MWQASGKLVGSRRWGWESRMPSWCPNIWLCWFKVQVFRTVTAVRTPVGFSSLISRGTLVPFFSQTQLLTTLAEHRHTANWKNSSGLIQASQMPHRTKLHPAPSLMKGAGGLSGKVPCKMRPSCRFPWSVDFAT